MVNVLFQLRDVLIMDLEGVKLLEYVYFVRMGLCCGLGSVGD